MSDEVANPYNPDGKKITFYDALNDLRCLSNLDVYVTGSNSKMLSSDILTEFRGCLLYTSPDTSAGWLPLPYQPCNIPGKPQNNWKTH